MTVAGRPSAMNASASLIPSSVLPVAVAPATTTSGGASAIWPYCTSDALPARVQAGRAAPQDPDQSDHVRGAYGEHGRGWAARGPACRLLPGTGAGRRRDDRRGARAGPPDRGPDPGQLPPR